MERLWRSSVVLVRVRVEVTVHRRKKIAEEGKNEEFHLAVASGGFAIADSDADADEMQKKYEYVDAQQNELMYCNGKPLFPLQ